MYWAGGWANKPFLILSVHSLPDIQRYAMAIESCTRKGTVCIYERAESQKKVQSAQNVKTERCATSAAGQFSQTSRRTQPHIAAPSAVAKNRGRRSDLPVLRRPRTRRPERG